MGRSRLTPALAVVTLGLCLFVGSCGSVPDVVITNGCGKSVVIDAKDGPHVLGPGWSIVLHGTALEPKIVVVGPDTRRRQYPLRYPPRERFLRMRHWGLHGEFHFRLTAAMEFEAVPVAPSAGRTQPPGFPIAAEP